MIKILANLGLNVKSGCLPNDFVDIRFEKICKRKHWDIMENSPIGMFQSGEHAPIYGPFVAV